MCGIAGFIGFNNNKELADKSNQIQKHRGPDCQGIWSNDYIALANQRLSIIDLNERANLPLSKNNLIIVFNGEIYNYLELKRSLLSKKPETKFITTSDTEVIAEYYREYGEECVKHFRGMFAFVIYDIENKQIFGARDHFGIKPLYYYKESSKFAFASELKTLSKIPNFNKTINMKSMISSLNYLWIPGNESIFQNIFKIPPGHYFTYRNDELRIEKFWELNDALVIKESVDACSSNLNKVLINSLNYHLIADVKVSTFLSGGLDSSFITVIAKEKIKKLEAFTVSISKGDQNIEMMPLDHIYAKRLAKEFDLEHTDIRLTPSVLELLPLMVKHLDEPIGDPAAINTYIMCNEAHKHGIKVILSGMGADEIFMGYRRQKALLLSVKYQKIPLFFRYLIKNAINYLPVRAFGRGFKTIRWMKKFITFADLPLADAYRMSYSYYDHSELNKLLNSNFEDIIKEIEEDHNKLFSSFYKNDIINQMCFTDIKYFMNGLNLTYTDRASMASSVEVRVPFIDKEVIEYAMSIPGKYKYKKRISKYIFKKAAENYLPKDIVYRPKASFGAPIRSWISDELRPLVDELLSKENIKKRGFLNPDYVAEIIEKDRKGLEDNAYRIYQLLTLELWFREYLDDTEDNTCCN